MRGSYNPDPTRRSVWARSGSLAATTDISVDFSSSGYLDVSVPQVCFPSCDGMTAVTSGRVSPFGHPRINACVPLPLAYRSLPRPSSPLCAQASPTCFRSLDYKIVSSKARAISKTSDFPNSASLKKSSHDDSLSHDLPYIRCQTANATLTRASQKQKLNWEGMTRRATCGRLSATRRTPTRMFR